MAAHGDGGLGGGGERAGYRTAVAGSRGLDNSGLVGRAIGAAGWAISEVVTRGDCGVDSAAMAWAGERNIPSAHIDADWDQYGQGAEAIRGQRLADHAQKGVFVWDGESRATRQLITLMRRQGKEVVVLKVPRRPEKDIERAEAMGKSVVRANVRASITRYNSPRRGAPGAPGDMTTHAMA